MKRSNLNFLIDILAFSCFLLLTTTGVLVHYVLPKESGYFKQIWGLERHQWGEIHFWIAIAFLLILALHLLLHWRWLVSTAKTHANQYSGFKMGIGTVAFLALIALAVAPLLSPVVDYQQIINVDIRGSMTLQELTDETGVPVDYLLGELKLPEDVDKSVRFRVLKARYHFEMSDVKKAVVRYKSQH